MTTESTAVLIMLAVFAALVIAEIWRELHSFKVTRYTMNQPDFRIKGKNSESFSFQIFTTGNTAGKMSVCIRPYRQNIRI